MRMIYWKTGLAILLVLAVAHVCVGQDKTTGAQTELVAMSDLVKLATDVYLPGDGTGKYPVIVARTPYGKSQGQQRPGSGRGVARLRLRDPGPARPLQVRRSTPPSSSATTGWASTRTAARRWSGSPGNPGATARSAAGAGPPWESRKTWRPPLHLDELKAQFVAVAFSDYYSQGVYQGGAFRTQLSERWLRGNGTDREEPGNVRGPPAVRRLLEAAELRNACRQGAGTGRLPRRLVRHLPSGHHQLLHGGPHHGGEGARGKCRLVIGPIGHGTFNELKYPANAAKGPACGDAFAWFDYVLLGKDNAVAKEKAVHYYVMGDPTDPKAPGNYWRHADDWPPPSRPTPFYFHPDGTLVREKPPEGNDSKTYTYDPKNPVPNVGGQELGVPLGPMDQRRVENRPDVLLFSSRRAGRTDRSDRPNHGQVVRLVRLPGHRLHGQTL